MAPDELELPEEMEAGQEISDEELEATEVEESAEAAQPSAEKATAKKVNLDDIEEFRSYKASRDKQFETERQQRLAYEQQLANWQRQQQQQYVAGLSAQLDNTFDAGQRGQIIEQIAAIRAADYTQQWGEWNAYMQSEITSRGLDSQDQRFRKQYSGEAGAREFQADLLAAENEKLKTERDSLSKQVAGVPSQIKNMVQQELAKLAQEQGFNYHVAEEPTGAVDGDASWARDKLALQQGRMSGQEFTRRYGKK